MAILIEAFSVVVRNSTIAAKYPGGRAGYERDCPNATYCSDDHLSRIGFMMQRDAEVFVAQLAAKGFTPSRNQAADDVTLVSQSEGPLQPCGWLELGQYQGVRIAWMAGSDVGDLHAPPGWSLERPLQWMSAEEARRRLEFVRSQDDLDVYRDKATGQELYVGRTASASEANASRHDDLYKEACALIEGLIVIHGEAPGKLDPGSRQRLEDAVPLFGEVVAINPGNWAAMWLLGKTYQRLGDYERALPWFSRAHRVNPDHPDMAREASIAAMEVGRPEEAVPFCDRALAAKPDDPGLRANLALALLFSGRPGEAQAVAGEALRRDPADEITAQIVRIIDEVLSGARPCPHHSRDLG
jgi:tetratricopeptide (TPR) repeat protein